jgi:hypothetical protein
MSEVFEEKTRGFSCCGLRIGKESGYKCSLAGAPLWLDSGYHLSVSNSAGCIMSESPSVIEQKDFSLALTDSPPLDIDDWPR